MPLPNTIEDFWTMIFEFKSTSIVMLNGMSQTDPVSRLILDRLSKNREEEEENEQH